MEACAADCGNAFLHGKTYEKYYITAGPEFKALEGRILLIDQSWSGLKTSAARWHQFLSETSRPLGFFPSKVHPDLRIRDCGTHYEYCCMYVDDVIFVSLDPMQYICIMEYEYHLKGVGVREYYLGGDMEL